MSEARIGRVLVARLHQAIADLLPTRLEFYENWLNVAGLREGTIGLAPLTAVLSFLRGEGHAYNLITSRAITKITRGVVTVDLRGSLFCEVRETSIEPLCGFYASAIAGVLRLFDV